MVQICVFTCWKDIITFFNKEIDFEGQYLWRQSPLRTMGCYVFIAQMVYFFVTLMTLYYHNFQGDLQYKVVAATEY